MTLLSLCAIAVTLVDNESLTNRHCVLVYSPGAIANIGSTPFKDLKNAMT